MIPCQRHLFDLSREVAYFNCAYMSPLMTHVAKIGRTSVTRKTRPWEIRPADFFSGPERARSLFAQVIGADPEGVALVPSASYGIATAARNVPVRAGQTILVLADQRVSFCQANLESSCARANAPAQ